MELDHAHLRPQTEYLCGKNGELLVDFIGKWERLGQDFADVCDRLGVQLILPRENISQRSHYRDYYSKSSRDLVAARYLADIDMFDYGFFAPVKRN